MPKMMVKYPRTEIMATTGSIVWVFLEVQVDTVDPAGRGVKLHFVLATSHSSIGKGSPGNPIGPVFGTIRGDWALLGLSGKTWLLLCRL